jgi:hypothetical protein
MNLYIVDYWAPFPASEYGGLLVVAAENHKQLAQILRNYDDQDYPERLDAAVEASKCFALRDGNPQEPGVVARMLT